MVRRIGLARHGLADASADMGWAGPYLPAALFNDIPVANVCCRFEHDGRDSVKLYIMTLGTLAPYRSLGIATKVRLWRGGTEREGERRGEGTRCRKSMPNISVVLPPSRCPCHSS